MRPYYYSLDEYNKEVFGKKLYKLSIPGGFTCPNRDGTIGTGGCIFCSEGGSGEFTPEEMLSVPEQLEQAKQRILQKFRPSEDGEDYIAYFQSFTATYGDLQRMRERFHAAADWPQTAVVDIATRPDCLQEGVLDLLAEIRKKKQVWVELGLQTASEETARLIHRGYTNEVYLQAVRRLHALDIPVVAHVILGLPGESREDVLRTIRFINTTGTDGVKLQLLHVLQGTALAQTDYTPLTMEAYIDLVLDCLSHMRKDIVVHRLTGDGDKRLLIAPLWSADKKRVRNALHRAMREREIIQGNLVADVDKTDALFYYNT